MTTRLTQRAKDLIKSDNTLYGNCMVWLDVKARTIEHYLSTDSEQLTKLDFLNAMVEYTKLPLSELIEGDKLSKLLSK